MVRSISLQENEGKGGNSVKTSFWKREAKYEVDQEKPTLITRSVALEMKKRKFSKILELGCGRGRNSLYLAREGFSVTGVDYNVEELLVLREYATQKNIKVNLALADVSELPFGEDMFDVVLSLNVLTFIKEQIRPQVIQEVRRVLKSGGLFVAVERSLEDPLCGKGEEIESNTYEYQMTVQHFFSSQELQSLLSQLEVVVLNEFRTIDAAHDHPHIHGSWRIVAFNRKKELP